MSQDVDLIKKTLRQVLRDKSAPAAAKVSAAKTLGEMLGMIGRNQKVADDDKPLSEMTDAELQAKLDSVIKEGQTAENTH